MHQIFQLGVLNSIDDIYWFEIVKINKRIKFESPTLTGVLLEKSLKNFLRDQLPTIFGQGKLENVTPIKVCYVKSK